MNGDRNKQKRETSIPARLIVSAFFALVFGFLLFFISTRTAHISFDSHFSFLQPNKKISVLIVGDIMLDRNVRNKIDQNGFDSYFSGVKELVAGADIAVGNLEGPFTKYPSKTATLVNKDLVFTFDPALAPKLADLGFDALGLANNHILNFGQEGLESTREYIREAGMSYYGEPNNSTELSTITEKNGIKVGFVGFHEFSYINYDKVLAEIDGLRPQVDVLIVSPHWGIEYQKTPTDNQKKWARQFIDHGADAVIGSHPHVVEESDIYKGKQIFYSLGNFAFDQYFSEQTMTGLAVEMQISKGKDGAVSISYTTIPVKVDRNGPTI